MKYLMFKHNRDFHYLGKQSIVSFSESTKINSSQKYRNTNALSNHRYSIFKYCLLIADRVITHSRFNFEGTGYLQETLLVQRRSFRCPLAILVRRPWQFVSCPRSFLVLLLLIPNYHNSFRNEMLDLSSPSSNSELL